MIPKERSKFNKTVESSLTKVFIPICGCSDGTFFILVKIDAKPQLFKNLLFSIYLPLKRCSLRDRLINVVDERCLPPRLAFSRFSSRNFESNAPNCHPGFVASARVPVSTEYGLDVKLEFPVTPTKPHLSNQSQFR